VRSLCKKRTCPVPPGDHNTRQWLALVVSLSPAASVRRMKEFSPVRRILLGSVGLIVAMVGASYEILIKVIVTESGDTVALKVAVG